jgi:hypothetical protein
VKEYALSEVFHHPESEILNNDVTDPVPESRPRETNLKSASASSSLSNGVEIKEESNDIIDYVPFPEKKKSSLRDKKRKLKKFSKCCVLSLTFTTTIIHPVVKSFYPLKKYPSLPFMYPTLFLTTTVTHTNPNSMQSFLQHKYVVIARIGLCDFVVKTYTTYSIVM